MSDKYPVLTSMGVLNPTQIASYNVYKTREDTDTLRIKYKRPKGSFLPVTRRYNFGRTPKQEMVDSGTRKTELVYEVSPLLSKAVNELEGIVGNKKSQQELKQQIFGEIDRITNDFHADLANLKKLVEKLDD